MSHWSENSSRLDLNIISIKNINDINKINTSDTNVWLFLIRLNIDNLEESLQQSMQKNILYFSKTVNKDSIITVLTTPKFAADIYLYINKIIKLHLWIVIKLSIPIKQDGFLDSHHVTLLVLRKNKRSLDHTKTRIAYTYCPFCERTTKDYGGKKHLYHKYGTLMSDIWRDISYNPRKFPNEIIDRLQDLFGIGDYKKINVIKIEKRPILVVKDIQPTYGNLFTENSSNRIDKSSQLINDDCLSALKEIDDNSIDYCFADPPYNIEKKYDSWSDNMEISDYFKWCDRWLKELARILKPGRICSILNIPLWAIRHYEYLIKILNFHDWIVWEGLGLPVRMIMPAHYTILSFSRGTPRKLPGIIRKDHNPLEITSLKSLKENYCARATCLKQRKTSNIKDKDMITNLWWDIHRLKHNSRRVDHPTQLPPKLMYRLISLYTYENEIVLDPFNGTGTTTLSAAQLNRRYIGIELSDYYFRISKQRHNELSLGIDPFRKNNKTPKSKNSRVQRLKKQNYVISKKALQLEIKKITQQIGHIPTREEVQTLSQYPFKYYENYFIDWGEVCAAARTTGMSEHKNDSIKKIRPHKQQSLFDT